MYGRCDTERVIGNKAGGCVNAHFTPTFVLSAAAFPQVAAHVSLAQLTLVHHWGWEGHGPPLHRTTNKALQNANGNAACPASRPRPAGMSCDEYPFRSTLEGAAHSSDFSWAWVDRDQNSRAGSDLSAFYGRDRVLNGDAFWVAAQ